MEIVMQSLFQVSVVIKWVITNEEGYSFSIALKNAQSNVNKS